MTSESFEYSLLSTLKYKTMVSYFLGGQIPMWSALFGPGLLFFGGSKTHLVAYYNLVPNQFFMYEKIVLCED